MKIRFYNAKILIGKNNFKIIDGELWVEDNKISYVGGELRENNYNWDREIDVKQNLIMPGFKNAHSHSAMTFLRSYADDLPLLEWLEKQVFPMEAKLKEDDIYWLCKLAILEYLTSGITANFDMYFNQHMIAKASIETGFRTVLSGGISNFYSSIEKEEENYLKYNDHNELISYILGFHGEYTSSKELLENLALLAQKYKAPVFSHNSESKKEVLECINRYNMTPTSFINSLGIYEYGGGGFHCVHFTISDIEIFKQKKLWVVTNPASNLKLASGIAPIELMINNDLNIAIGTDGAASNNCLDMFREMFLVTGLAKVKSNDAKAVSADKVLSMAVSGGANALGLHDADCLEIGKLADLIIIDLNKPNMQPLNNIIKNIVYSGSKNNIKMTMINGKILYEDGQFYINVDPDDVYKKANQIMESFK